MNILRKNGVDVLVVIHVNCAAARMAMFVMCTYIFCSLYHSQICCVYQVMILLNDPSEKNISEAQTV